MSTNIGYFAFVRNNPVANGEVFPSREAAIEAASFANLGSTDTYRVWAISVDWHNTHKLIEVT